MTLLPPQNNMLEDAPARRPYPIMHSAAWIIMAIVCELPLLVQPFSATRIFQVKRCRADWGGRTPTWLSAEAKRKHRQEDQNEFSVSIGPGSVLATESLKFPRSLLVSGLVQVNMLVCTSDHKEDTLVRIGKEGILHANIHGVKTVEAHGKVYGNIECDRLIVGAQGEIMGDVSSGELAITPGGTIEGVVRCGYKPVPIVSFEENNDLYEKDIVYENRNGASATGVVSEQTVVDHVTPDPPALKNQPVSSSEIITDDFGNPLFPHGVSNSLPKEKEQTKLVSNPSDTTPTNSIPTDSFGNPLVPTSPSRSTLPKSKKFANLPPDIITDDFGNPLVPLPAHYQLQREEEEQELQQVASDAADATPDRTNMLTDDFGNPLIRVPDQDDVDSLRRNRDLVQQTRNLLDVERSRKVTEWSSHLQTPDEDYYSTPDTDNRDESSSTDTTKGTGLPDFLR